jgi:hypothetical protein
VEQVRDEGNAVSTTLVTVKLLGQAPKLAAVGFVPLRCQVLWFLKNRHLTFHVVTHKAQNHRFHGAIIPCMSTGRLLHCTMLLIAF